ncbi:MAG: ABC-F type ribosomal protection protein [Intestinibacter sp.]|uniref:ABC-F type ribosomal protection protein CplR n=1 Tax=Intestinibacter sp. TaxID=1965304 RepID=UPI0025C2D336|nr:ABC-F type ribosomal protection protein CplR [Intestinibacter sp.]MCI6736892.1 ABC-F type ribosomal protection protein [Intestinibacter sp.]
MSLLKVKNLKKYYSDRLVLDIDIFEINEGDKIGLIGGNGVGKSTFIKAIIGEIEIDSGEVNLTDSYSYISQIGDEAQSYSGNKIKGLLNAPDKYEEFLSGGEKIKVKIVNALKDNKKLIIADEPTSNLDKESIEVLTDMLKKHEGALLIVSHDRDVLDALCTTIAQIEDSKIKTYKGNYTNYLKLKDAEKCRQDFEYNQYISEKHRLEKAMEGKIQTRNNIRKTPKRMGNSEARLHKMGGQGNKRKLDKNIKAISTRIERLEVKEKVKEIEPIKINIQKGMEIVSKNLVEVNNLDLKAGDKLLLEDVSFKIKRNKKIALLGANGSGKTTLLKKIIDASKTENLRGKNIKINNKVKIGYFSQNQDTLNEEKSILENVKYNSSYNETFIRINLSLFGFREDDVYKKVEDLSGGERVKVALCKVILEDNNLLILDEPTNYLDIISMKSLEDALKNTEKTMIVVSHDKHFIEDICDYFLEIKDKKIIQFSGDYDSYIEEKNKEKLNEEDQKNSNEILILENRLSNLISMICMETDKELKEKYEKEFDEISDKLKKLR